MIEILRRHLQAWRPQSGVEDVQLLKQGRSHDIYLVTLADSSKCAAKITKVELSETLEKRAVKIVEHIKKHIPECRIPLVLWHNLDESPREGPVIIIEELVEGISLSVWNHNISLIRRRGFLDSLPGMLLDVWSVDAPTDTSPHDHSYSDWLEDSVDKALRRCVSKEARWGNAVDYLKMRSMIPRLTEQVDQYRGQRIAHGDMNAHNFIVNLDLEVQGLVDWDWTYVAPLPAVVQFPWFIADVPGWHNDGVGISETFEDDRQYLVRALETEERTRGLDQTLSGLLSCCRERQIFQSAISYPDIHREFVRERLSSLSFSVEAIREEISKFLQKHPTYADSPGLSEMETEIKEWENQVA